MPTDIAETPISPNSNDFTSNFEKNDEVQLLLLN